MQTTMMVVLYITAAVLILLYVYVLDNNNPQQPPPETMQGMSTSGGSRLIHHALAMATASTVGRPPEELDRYLTRNHATHRMPVHPIIPPTLAEHAISDPFETNILDRGVSIDTNAGTAWKTGNGMRDAIPIANTTTATSVAWLGEDTRYAADHTTRFSLRFSLQHPDSVVISIEFQTTNRARIVLESVSSGVQTTVYDHNDDPSNTSFHTDTASISASLAGGSHDLVLLIHNDHNKPALFWARGTIGGSYPGNIHKQPVSSDS